ncbi:MAG: response regulator receiver domain, partial [Desulfobacterales bacterium]
MEGMDQFMKLSEKVANNFLHTIVVIDDEAFFGEKISPPGKIVEPGKVGIHKREEYGAIDLKRTQHSLNAKEVIDNFALYGKVCSVLKPEEEQDYSIYKPIAMRTDAFIIDWEIHNDNGEDAIAIIGKIIESDLTFEPRLRLIIIYTGETDIDNITPKIKAKLDDYFDSYETSKDGVTFIKGYLRITVYFKNRLNLKPELHDRVISGENLAKVVSLEFSNITSGLVSNFTLESMSALRDNTHLILGKFGPKIDPPFLSHRALLPNPNDVKYHVIDLLINEYHSILEDYNVGKEVEIESVKAWLDHTNPPNKEILIRSKKVVIDKKCIIEWQEKSLEKSKWYKNLKPSAQKEIKNNIHRQLTNCFCKDN